MLPRGARTHLIVVACLFVAAELLAQERPLELTAMAGYQVGGSYDLDDETLEASGAGALTLGLGLRASDDFLFEIFFVRQDTELRSQRPAMEVEPIDVALEYYHGAGVFELVDDGPVKPYLTAGAGGLRLARKDAEGSDWRFSVSFGGGFKVLPDHVGFRADVRFLVPFRGPRRATFSGAGGAGDAAATLQVNVSAGVVLAF